ncbi:hypothetical protein [Streptomyces sp. NPDC018833]|uniref:hypothetical protein n=1 Tax=Streptomyces sp. NPDC018833 TaxID=3365053 RepID=UPI0037BB3700
MATAKTKSLSFADIVAAEELKAAEKAAKARGDLAELRDNIERWEDEYQEAAGRVAGMRNRYARGIETATAAEFAEALAAEERAKLLAHKHIENTAPDGKDPRVKRAERALPASDKKVAKAVAEALLKANVFPAAQVFSTYADPRGLVPTEGDAPVLIVSQPESSYDGTFNDRQYKRHPSISGVTLSADVVLTLYRRPEHRDIVPERIVKALSEAKGEILHPNAINVLSTVVGDGLEKDEVRFTMSKIDNPDASPELKARRDEWYASRRTTLTESAPQSGMDLWIGGRSSYAGGRI